MQFPYYIWLFPSLINLSGDIERNPGPKKDFSQMFSIVHWNLNSLVAHNFTTVALLKGYLSVQNSISSPYQKHTSILVLRRMMITCEYLNMI